MNVWTWPIIRAVNDQHLISETDIITFPLYCYLCLVDQWLVKKMWLPRRLFDSRWGRFDYSNQPSDCPRWSLLFQVSLDFVNGWIAILHCLFLYAPANAPWPRKSRSGVKTRNMYRAQLCTYVPSSHIARLSSTNAHHPVYWHGLWVSLCCHIPLASM